MQKKVIYLFTFPSGRLKSILSPLSTDIFLCKTKICTTLRTGTSYFSFILLFKIQPAFFNLTQNTHTHTSTNRSGMLLLIVLLSTFFCYLHFNGVRGPRPHSIKKGLVSRVGKRKNLKPHAHVRTQRTHAQERSFCLHTWIRKSGSTSAEGSIPSGVLHAPSIPVTN